MTTLLTAWTLMLLKVGLSRVFVLWWGSPSFAAWAVLLRMSSCDAVSAVLSKMFMGNFFRVISDVIIKKTTQVLNDKY